VDAGTDAEAGAGAGKSHLYDSADHRLLIQTCFTNRNSATHTPMNSAAETASDAWMLLKAPARPTVIPLKVRRPEAAMA
jgi:hypothetical protein